MINSSSGIKLTGFEARTDAHRIAKLLEEVGLVTDRVTHHLVTMGPPVTARLHRLAADKAGFSKSEFDTLLANGIVRPSHSP